VLTTALSALLPAVLVACGPQPDEPRHSDWVFRAKLAFLSEDLTEQRPALPPGQFRLVFPYIAGDLYGAPTTGDFIHPIPAAGDSFEIDLNRGQQALLSSLEPTEFSLSYLQIMPREARIARLTPMALQADGIEQIGHTDWVDPGSKKRLLLVYVDRPASITGQTTVGGHSVRYQLRAESAGYIWIECLTDSEGDIYRVVPKPAQLILAITPDTHK
jgi:hypothetical protein